MPLTNPPFMPEKGKPAYHLRESTPEELELHRRLVEKMEKLRQPTGGQDDVRSKSK